MSLLYLDKHGNAKVAPSNTVSMVAGVQFIYMLLDFFNIADLKIILMML